MGKSFMHVMHHQILRSLHMHPKFGLKFLSQVLWPNWPQPVHWDFYYLWAAFLLVNCLRVCRKKLHGVVVVGIDLGKNIFLVQCR